MTRQGRPVVASDGTLRAQKRCVTTQQRGNGRNGTT